MIQNTIRSNTDTHSQHSAADMTQQDMPNLFIIGAMKSGTSSLHEYIGDHPDLFMAEPKEPMYFSQNDDWRAGFDDYMKLFADRTNETWFGESSTEYTKLPQYSDVAPKLHECNPNARLIYIMRDPVERSLSHYWHVVKN